MFDVNQLFGKGVKNTLLLKNGLNFSVGSQFTVIQTNTLIDRWQFTSISAAEYTIFVDFDTDNKEILRCLLVGGPSLATVTIYGRANLGNPLVDLSAVVNDSYIDFKASVSSSTYQNSKLTFQATYFESINPVTR